MVVSDEQRTFIQNFIDRAYPQELVISQNFSGHLVTHTDWPSILRNKGVFFVKREPEPLQKVSVKKLTLIGLGLIKINTVSANFNNTRPSLILNN